MLTAYDATMALLVDRAGIDVILVGDSLGMVVLGEETTVGVTLDMMVHHCRAVTNGASTALVVADLPFLTYQASLPDAIRSAGRLMQEGRATAVKLEGGVAVCRNSAGDRECRNSGDGPCWSVTAIGALLSEDFTPWARTSVRPSRSAEMLMLGDGRRIRSGARMRFAGARQTHHWRSLDPDHRDWFPASL